MGPQTTRHTQKTPHTNRHSGRGEVRYTDTAGGEAANQASNGDGGGVGEVGQRGDEAVSSAEGPAPLSAVHEWAVGDASDGRRGGGSMGSCGCVCCCR